jgi:hypothetical protein
VYILCRNWSYQGLHSALLPTSLIASRLEEVRLGDMGEYHLHHRLQYRLDPGPDFWLPTNLSVLGSSQYHQGATGVRIPLLR